MIYRGERGKPVAGLGGYQMFDSLAVEASGNVCVATLISGCISVIAPDGTLVEQVPTGDRVTTNIAFGGAGTEDRLHHAVRQGRTDCDGLGASRTAAEFPEQVTGGTKDYPRHCERSEAIHAARGKNGLLRRKCSSQ